MNSLELVIHKKFLSVRNVFSEDELLEDSVVRDFRATAKDGKNYDTKICVSSVG